MSEYSGIRAEPTLEVFVTDDRHNRRALRGGCRLRSWRRWRRLRLAVLVGEITTERDLRSYKLEVVRRHEAHVYLFRHAVIAGQREGERVHAREALEFVLRRFAQIDKICVGKGEVLDAAIVQVGRNDDELIGILIWKWTQQHGIGDTEDGGACADAPGNGQCGSQCKDRTLPQCSACECQITQRHRSTSFTGSWRAKNTTCVAPEGVLRQDPSRPHDRAGRSWGTARRNRCHCGRSPRSRSWGEHDEVPPSADQA